MTSPAPETRPVREAVPALQIDAVTKSYGENAALSNLSLTLEDGATCALVGPNGAGKTTLISILLGLLHQDSGTVSIYGDAAGSIAARRHIGFLPDVPAFPGWMKADEVLRFFLELSGKTDCSVIAPLLESVGLAGNQRPVRMFSRGMRQRLGLAQALVAAPRLLILDEPTSALDPAGQRLFHDIVRSLRGRATVLYSTHSLAEAERVCDSAIIIDRGRLLRHATLDALILEGQGVTVEVSGNIQSLTNSLRAEPWVTSIAVDGSLDRARLSVRVTSLPEAQGAMPEVLAGSGALLHSFEPRGLEDIFLDLTAQKQRSREEEA